MINETIMVIGNLARQARYNEGTKPYIAFTLGARANKDSETEWFEVTKCGSTAIAKYLIKGTRVLVIGRPVVKTRRDKLMNEVKYRAIYAEEVILLNTSLSATIEQGTGQEKIIRQDLPF